MATPKQAHTLTDYFGKKYKEKYGIKPNLNRYKARWGFDAVLMDLGVEETKELIDYYFETASPNSHSLEFFFNQYDKLAEAKGKSDEDARRLAELREQSRIRTEEWRNRRSGNE